jgi:transcriptional regulator GlxA family with amidase domain
MSGKMCPRRPGGSGRIDTFRSILAKVAHACLVLLLDGVADGPVGITLDVLGAARRIEKAAPPELPRRVPTLAPRLVSLDGLPVRTAARRVVDVDGAASLHGLGRSDVLLLPGLGMATPDEVERALTRNDVARAANLAVRAAARGLTVAASCSATFVLGAGGILDGREATTTWWLAPTFARLFPRVDLRTDRMLVASGRVSTAGSAFAHADLTLALVAGASGASLARLAARYLLIDERPSQARYMIAEHLRTDNDTVRALERFVVKNLGRNVSLEEMARATATSPRTLARRTAEALAMTPHRFAQRLKMQHAVHLLETTNEAVDAIAARVGYAEPAAFRRVLRRETGKAPREHRR